MRPCPPSEFQRRWPDALVPVSFAGSPPAVPGGCAHALAKFGLPREVTIHCHNDATLRFSGSATPLAAVWERGRLRGLQIGSMPTDWRRFWHLADQQYLQGGGWIGLEEVTGRLVVIDLDQPEPVYLLNSSVHSFYTTLAYFLNWSQNVNGGAAETALLLNALLAQDCIPPAELEPFWLNLLRATVDCDSDLFAVRLGGPSP